MIASPVAAGRSAAKHRWRPPPPLLVGLVMAAASSEDDARTPKANKTPVAFARSEAREKLGGKLSEVITTT